RDGVPKPAPAPGLHRAHAQPPPVGENRAEPPLPASPVLGQQPQPLPLQMIGGDLFAPPTQFVPAIRAGLTGPVVASGPADPSGPASAPGPSIRLHARLYHDPTPIAVPSSTGPACRDRAGPGSDKSDNLWITSRC